MHRSPSPIAAIVLVPIAAGILYWRLGSPVPARRAAERTAVAASPTTLDIDAALKQLEAHLAGSS